MTAPENIAKLVESFKANYDEYMSGVFNETQTRVSFINPLFEALGWDVRNEESRAETYREVVHEESIEVGRGLKAPDMTFRIGGIRKFFVECKKPSVDLKEETHPAYQLRRYGWSAKLPLSILTDFEEFAVYDCRIKPKKSDKASVALIKYYKFEDYIDRWDEIAALFSREAVLTGAFDRYAVKVRKRGTAEVDDAFLEEIERWREVLAKSIALKNRGLTDRELNYAVQQTIDRIIFLRICEDRGIEPYQALAAVSNGANVYDRLKQLFVKADQRFNSGLFHFNSERGRNAPPDELTPRIKIDDEVLKEIIASLYYPNPYEFSVFPADILGQVYERFLGKVIRLTAGHHAKVEEKPEVRKAGGVYYTPTYIVDYIVKNTVGKLLEGKTPNKVEKLRILDPACGSGSFLIGAYQHLLDWHLKWYLDQGPAKHKKAMYQLKKDEWRLTTAERKRILLNNIYGVDIDTQAVEVTKLSLLLKVLEGENKQTLDKQMKLFHERALPDLESNIKCGNSLIGTEELDKRQKDLFGDEDQTRINAFDWKKEFPEIFNTGGFDAVIGNPPYVRSINLKESDPVLWDIYRSQYRAASAREWDIYLIFVEKGLSLLNKNGKLGYILPNKFLNSQVGENLRSTLSEGHHLERLVHFGAFQIFPGATTYTCLLFLDSRGKDRAGIARYIGPVNESGVLCPLPESRPALWHISEVVAPKLKAAAWEFAASGGPLLEKFKQWPGLGNIAQVFQGTGTRADKVYMVENRGRKGRLIRVYSTEKEEEYLLEPTFLKPALRGRSIGRYEIADKNLSLIVPYEVIGGKSELVQQRKFVALAPKTFKYLNHCKPRLDEREKGRFKGDGWYCYGRPQNLDRFDVPEKIVLPDVANRGTCFLDRDGMWLLDTAYAITLKPDVGIDLRYILAILNSPLLTHFLKETGSALRGGYFRMKTAYLNPFPIRTINFSKRDDKTKHDRIVKLVEQMLTLKSKAKKAKTPHEKTAHQRQLDSADRQIDQLVYELYGLTEEEIKIVEGDK